MSFFQQYFFLLDKSAKRQLPFLGLLFLISALFDVVGVGMIGMFLMLIVNINLLFKHMPDFMKSLLLRFDHNILISIIGVIIIAAFILKAGVALYSQRRIALFVAETVIHIKSRLMKGYQQAAYIFHLKHNSAYLINSIMQAGTFTSGVVMPSLNLTCNATIAVGIIFALMFLHPIMTILLAIMFTVIAFIYDFFMKKKMIQIGKTLAVANGEISKSILEGLGGLKEIRVLGKEKYFCDKLKNAAYNYAQSLATNNALQQVPRYVIETGASIFLIILLLGALWTGMNPVNIIPTIGVFAAACMRLLPTVNQLMIGLNQMRGSIASMQMLYAAMSELDTIKDSTLMMENATKAPKFTTFSLESIYYHYPNSQHFSVENISMVIHRGQSVGLIGSSGAGKSTLVNIILGLLTPKSGRLLLNNQPITNSRTWLNHFAYIPQHIFLLDDTLKHNIAMGVEDADIDDDVLNKTIQMAQLTKVVEALPDGVDTLLGENGVRLSGGQRQRIALARALYHERDIIIMDEATSALDNETEKEVIDAIKALHGIKTLIIIAHRFTTIEHCDIVYKLADGKIIAQGCFADVVNKGSEAAFS